MVIPGYYYRWSDRTFTTYLVYYLAGCYIGLYYDRFTAWVKKHPAPILIFFSLSAGADLWLLYRLRVQGISSPLDPTPIWCICWPPSSSPSWWVCG